VKTQKTWGHEVLIHNDSYCCKLLVYEKNIASSLHYHEFKHETFVVISGKFLVSRIGHMMEMLPGDRLVIPPMTPHRVRCLEPGTIVEASSFDDPSDCVRLSLSET
jgi:mannose-6-phosphate isomerase-like protein (cupin superfamily)